MTIGTFFAILKGVLLASWLLVIYLVAKTRRVNPIKYTLVSVIPLVAPYVLVKLLVKPHKEVLERLEKLESQNAQT